MPIVAALLLGSLAGGCQSGPSEVDETADRRTRANDRNDTDRSSLIGAEDDGSVSTVIDARPAAMVNGRTIRWGELRPMLTEAAGAVAMEELILQRGINRKLDDRNITITEDDLAAERALLLDTLHEDTDRATRLLRELRNRRGLGPTRFQMLLHRNAAMRALVRDEVQVGDNAARRMFEYMHGEKRQARLITVSSLSEAESAIDRVRDGESFAEVALEISTDVSAGRGGMLEPISRVDPSYPQSLRDELWALDEGEVSSPILLDNAYAILQLHRVYPPDEVEYDEVRDEMQRLARLNQERALMERLGRQILGEASLSIFDPSLESSWKQRSRFELMDAP